MIDEDLTPFDSSEEVDLPRDLLFNEEQGSYELDIEDDDPEWDHPADYSTISLGAAEDNSDYDVSNPFVGSEYSDLDELQEEEFAKANMRIASKKELKTTKFDAHISHDERVSDQELDDEGYPVNS